MPYCRTHGWKCPQNGGAHVGQTMAGPMFAAAAMQPQRPFFNPNMFPQPGPPQGPPIQIQAITPINLPPTDLFASVPSHRTDYRAVDFDAEFWRGYRAARDFCNVGPHGPSKPEIPILPPLGPGGWPPGVLEAFKKGFDAWCGPRAREDNENGFKLGQLDCKSGFKRELSGTSLAFRYGYAEACKPQKPLIVTELVIPKHICEPWPSCYKP